MAITANILNENFEGTGYSVSGWSESVGAGSTVDEDSVAVTPPIGGGSQVLKIDKVSPNFVARTRWDYGSILPITYTTFYVLVTVGLTADATTCYIANGSDTVAYGRSWDISLRRVVGGNLRFRLNTDNNWRADYGTSVGAGAITLNQWYKMSMKFDYTNNAYEFLIDGNSVSTGTVTYTGVRYFWIGDGASSVTATYYVDTFQVSSTGYVTGDPKVIMVM